MSKQRYSGVERLQQVLSQTSPPSLEEARSRLPDLVMAELAGEDVEVSFGDVLLALDQYPVLAEEYAVLMAEMYDELAG